MQQSFPAAAPIHRQSWFPHCTSKFCHDDVGTRSAVVDVAKDVQLVNAQGVYDLADGDDEVGALSSLHDCFDDAAEVGLLVVVEWIFVQQFLYDVGVLSGKHFSHL